jgi:hypothetical protein
MSNISAEIKAFIAGMTRKQMEQHLLKQFGGAFEIENFGIELNCGTETWFRTKVQNQPQDYLRGIVTYLDVIKLKNANEFLPGQLGHKLGNIYLGLTANEVQKLGFDEIYRPHNAGDEILAISRNVDDAGQKIIEITSKIIEARIPQEELFKILGNEYIGEYAREMRTKGIEISSQLISESERGDILTNDELVKFFTERQILRSASIPYGFPFEFEGQQLELNIWQARDMADRQLVAAKHQ